MDWQIELQDWMKLKSWVGTGGEAKQVIQSGQVKVNGEVETRRRRKLKENDIVEYSGKQDSVARSHE
jgi:ribosome-associated protein